METSERTHAVAPPSRNVVLERPIPEATYVRIAHAATLAVAPVILVAGLLYHPHIGSPLDVDFLERLAEAVTADPVRWAVAHLLVAVGSAFILLAFLVIRNRLRSSGEEHRSAIGIPFIVLGSVGYALLPAMEFVPLAAAEAGNDVVAAQAALLPWFAPTLFSSAALFLVGTILFATGLIRGRWPNRDLAWVVAVALVVAAACRMVPLAVVQFHVQALAFLVALWPLAYVSWNRT